MSRWERSQLIDIMSQIDMDIISEEIPEQDLYLEIQSEQEKHSWSKVWVAAISGLIATSMVFTTVVVMMKKRKNWCSAVFTTCRVQSRLRRQCGCRRTRLTANCRVCGRKLRNDMKRRWHDEPMGTIKIDRYHESD